MCAAVASPLGEMLDKDVRDHEPRLLTMPQGIVRQCLDGAPLINPSESCDPPPDVFIPVLPEESRHVGNCVRKVNASAKPIGAEQARVYAAKHGKNVRGRCDGLVYDDSFPGYSPLLWEHVACAPYGAHGSHRFFLESVSQKGVSHLVDVCYRPSKFLPAAVREHSQHCLTAHSNVRETECAAGLMVGVGDRLGYSGFHETFKVIDSQANSLLDAGMHAAGDCFQSHFCGRAAGWEEMMSRQKSLWPGREGATCPKSWFVSHCYGGAKHCDLDGDRSFAVWHSSGLGKSGPWWFLFPNHGLAVQIVDCTWISWDGRVTPHCTAVPYHVSPEECLFSLMCTLPGRLCHFIERKQHGLEQLQQQQSQSRTAACMFQQIREAYQVLGPAQKLHVLVREVLPAPAHMAGKKRALIRWGRQHVRFAKHVVLECDMSSVWVKDVNNSKCTQLSRHEVNNLVTWAE